MPMRTFGWVQDPEDLQKLRRVAGVFDRDSAAHAEVRKAVSTLVASGDGRGRLLKAMSRRPLRLSYRDLVGTASTPRSAARCNGIIQAAIPGQKRPFISDWPADNFVRWTHALGFVDWSAEDDCFQITPEGARLSRANAGSEKEYQILADGLLSYPPAVRVIGLLAEAAKAGKGGLTKFEIGRHLGFQGEMGFTTISQNFYIRKYLLAESAQERSKIRANWEGSADKYARMICSWLFQLKHPWVRAEEKEFRGETRGQKNGCKLKVYELTKTGFEERKKTTGKSSSRRVHKRVPVEMLCTKAPGRGLLRARRANVVSAILKKPLTVEEITGVLGREGINTSPGAVESDLQGLANIGLTIEKTQGAYRCRDKIVGLKIPGKPETIPASDAMRKMKEECEAMLRVLPRDYLALIQMAFDKSQSRMFEIKVAELLTEQCRFGGGHLGGASRPDAVIYDGATGAVIDTKSYKGGFNIPASEVDKMTRYLTDIKKKPATNATCWWDVFPANVRKFLFLFVSGQFGGNFKAQLKKINGYTDAKGGAVTVVSLLLFADKIASGEIQKGEFLRRIAALDEIKI